MDRLGGVWLIVIPAWLWALLPLAAASGGAICIMEVTFSFVTGVPIAFVWLGGLVWALSARRTRGLWAWFSVPAVWAVALALASTDLPFIARFYLSEPALRRDAECGAPSTSYDSNAKCVGLFHVQTIWRHERTVAFATDSKLFDRVGVIYAPDGLPAELPMEVESLLFAQYTHINGPWYKFEIGD